VLNPDAGYLGVENFEFVSMVVNVPNVLAVSRQSGITTMDEFVARAAEAPDTVSYASFGNGTLPHLTALMFADEIGAQMLHIPYPGGAPAVVDILAGNVDTGFLNVPTLMPHIQSGDIVPLAVASTIRASQLPDVPTLDELGFAEYEMGAWLGLAVAAGTPPEAVATLDAAIAAVLDNPEVQERIQTQGADLFYKNSADFAAFVAQDAEVVLGLIETSGVRNAQ
jgi:tripartite-type tricarboxylate transporter receptor subunit TctC